MSTQQLSPDGLWWWNGTQWVSALSPDGRWRWDGEQWVQHVHRDVPLEQRRLLVPTLDTRPLQTTVVAYLLLSTVANIYLMANRQASLLQGLPGYQSDSAAGQAAMNSIVNASIVGGIAGILVWNGLLVFGTVFRWRWTYYVIMILGLLGSIGVVANVLLLALQAHSDAAPSEFVGVLSGLANLAIALWMLRLRRERGTAWAMQHLRVTA